MKVFSTQNIIEALERGLTELFLQVPGVASSRVSLLGAMHSFV